MCCMLGIKALLSSILDMRGNSDYRYDARRIMANLEDYLDYLLSDYGAGLHEFR